MKKATHVYIGRKECGCCMSLVFEVYRETVSKEDTFMSCPHGQLAMALPN